MIAAMYTFTDESEASARQRFKSHGMTVDQWAKAKGFPSASVTAVLAGKNKGLRGQSHHIAVALGLKPAPNQTSPPAQDTAAGEP